MRRVEAEALVGASRDEVWRLLDDLEGMPRWLPHVRAVSASGPVRAGALYRERSMALGVPHTRDWEVVDYRPPVRQARRTRDGSLDQTVVLTLDARGSGTRLRVEVELRSRLAAPLDTVHEMLGALSAGRSARGFARAVKRSLEGLRR